MRRVSALPLLAAVVLALIAPDIQAAGPVKDYPIHPLPFTALRVTDTFWSPRLEVNRTVTIPHAFKQSEETGRIDNFAIAGKMKTGKFRGYFFNDSDVYKIIEGAAYALATHPDPALEKYVDGVIAMIAAAQEPDGYLYTARTLCGADYMPPGGKERWSDTENGHELYCAGHLYEAAVAYFQATGKRILLDVALKNANLVCNTFGPDKDPRPCGHQEIEIGLVKLYRLTGEGKFLKQAKFFLDTRGHGERRKLYGQYAQDHMPVIEQDRAVGHAVRAQYMYTAMADVAALTGESAYLGALDKIWEDVVSRKTYVTGGIGATGGNEGFSDEFFLPNGSAYCETCAGIANSLWNQRMFLFYGDAKYVDCIERVAYNAFLSGVSLAGDRFFYPNPLETFTGRERSPWFSCACCPSNDVRFIASIPGYAYAYGESALYVNLFIGSDATIPMKKSPLRVIQQTRYPWEGNVSITLLPEKATEFTLNVRIPGWARNMPVGSDLYAFLDEAPGAPVITLNGRRVQATVEKGFAQIRRVWKKGDRVELELPMPVRRVGARASVVSDRGRVALERGPVLFCAEGVDNKDGWVVNLVLPDSVPLRTRFRADLLGGVVTVLGTAYPVRRSLEGGLLTGEGQPFTAIPYYGWAHRGMSQMTVWQAREASAARPVPAPTIASTSKVTTSSGTGREALTDQLEPASSNDHDIPYFHWWPKKGSIEWIQYDFQARSRVSGAEVYWFDDTGIGECRLPVNWRVLYREGNEWKPVLAPHVEDVAKDRLNSMTFAPVETDALRLEVNLAPGFSAGLYEWRVR
jgi:DUF1680 family protein